MEIALEQRDVGNINSIVTEKVLPYINKIKEALKANVGRKVTHSKRPYFESFSLDFRPPAGYMDEFTFGDIGNLIRLTEGKYPSIKVHIENLSILGEDRGSNGIRLNDGDHLFLNMMECLKYLLNVITIE